MLYLGIESGSDKVLRRVTKGGPGGHPNPGRQQGQGGRLYHVVHGDSGLGRPQVFGRARGRAPPGSSAPARRTTWGRLHYTWRTASRVSFWKSTRASLSGSDDDEALAELEGLISGIDAERGHNIPGQPRLQRVHHKGHAARRQGFHAGADTVAVLPPRGRPTGRTARILVR